MIEIRSRSKQANGWMPSAIFNVLTVIIPFIAAQILITGFGAVPHQSTATAEILAQTRIEIDRAFQSLSENDGEARAQWAALISEKLEARNMSAARGFLLAAPQILSPSDQRSIREAADADPEGSEDERLLRAALLFVPSDIRVNYEASLIPRGIELVKLEEEEVDTEVTLATATQLTDTSLEAGLTSMTHTPAFSVLGTIEDLVNRSRDWTRGNRQFAVETRLTGIAMATPPSATGLESARLIEAASILKTAWRSNRLDPQYSRLLSKRLDAALPEDVLTENLEEALAEVAVLNVRAKRVQDAFAKSIDPQALRRLGPELQQISDIAAVTGPRGALTIMENIESPTDISRARLLTQAGGDRAVALVSQKGRDALSLTGSGMKWSRATVLNIVLLTAAFLALFLSALVVINQGLFGRRDDAIL